MRDKVTEIQRGIADRQLVEVHDLGPRAVPQYLRVVEIPMDHRLVIPAHSPGHIGVDELRHGSMDGIGPSGNGLNLLRC